jgi:hypothetical protein
MIVVTGFCLIHDIVLRERQSNKDSVKVMRFKLKETI